MLFVELLTSGTNKLIIEHSDNSTLNYSHLSGISHHCPIHMPFGVFQNSS